MQKSRDSTDCETEKLFVLSRAGDEEAKIEQRNRATATVRERRATEERRGENAMKFDTFDTHAKNTEYLNFIFIVMSSRVDCLIAIEIVWFRSSSPASST